MNCVRRLLAMPLFALSVNVSAANSGDFCTAMGNVYRDALLAESYNLAFDTNLVWKGKLYEALPLVWQAQLANDLNHVRPKLITFIAVVMKEVSRWNAEGLNGMERARKDIYVGLEPMSAAYVIRCAKLIREDEATISTMEQHP